MLNVECSLHKFNSPIPMPDFQPDGVVLVHFLLHDHELAGLNFVHQPPVDIFLHHALAQFPADGAQFLIRMARPGHANRGLPARIAGEGHRHAAARDLDALVAAKLVRDDFALFDFEIDPAFTVSLTWLVWLCWMPSWTIV